MGILRGSYLKQNIGHNIDIFSSNKRKLTSVVVFCRQFAAMANFGDFEGFTFGV